MTEQIAMEMYDEFLDEIYGEIKLGYLTFSPSEIMKKLDETAYMQGFYDYQDSLSQF